MKERLALNLNVNVQRNDDPANDGRRPKPIVRALQDVGSTAGGANLSKLLGIVRENKWLIIGCTLLAGVVSNWQVRQETPLYTAYATIVLEPRSEQVVNFDSVVPQFSFNNYFALASEVAEFRTDALMARVIDRLKLDQDPHFNPALRAPAEDEAPWYSRASLLERFDWLKGVLPASKEEPAAAPLTGRELRENIIDNLLGRFAVTNVSQSYLFSLSFQMADPEKAARILNTIAEEYIAQKRDVVFDTTQSAMDWLSGRVVELKSDLEAIEGEVESLPANKSLISEELLAARSAQLNSFRERLRDRELALGAAQSERSEIEASFAVRDYTRLSLLVSDPTLRNLAATLAEKPDATTAAERFAALIDNHLLDLRSRELRAQEQVQSLSGVVRETEAELKKNSADLVALRQLQREAEASRLVYEYSLGRLKEISVQQGIQTTPARILAPARIPSIPSYPNIPRQTLIGILLGCLLGIALAHGRSALRTSLRSSDEVASTFGLPVIGVIPRAATSRPQSVVSEVKSKPTAAMAEAIRNLRTSIQLSNVDAPPKVVMITSSVPGEGKTVLSITLAQTMAMSGKNVLLIDADLRRRFLGKYINVKGSGGLVSVLTGKADIGDVIVRDDETGLDVLLGEKMPASSTDLFSSNAFAALIERLRETYDAIVIDTPPVLAVSDARMIAQSVDATVYAIKWDATSRDLVKAGLELLRQAGVDVAGVALTQFNPRRMNRYGYYGYGAAGKKVSKYYEQRT